MECRLEVLYALVDSDASQNRRSRLLAVLSTLRV